MKRCISLCMLCLTTINVHVVHGTEHTPHAPATAAHRALVSAAYTEYSYFLFPFARFCSTFVVVLRLLCVSRTPIARNHMHHTRFERVKLQLDRCKQPLARCPLHYMANIYHISSLLLLCAAPSLSRSLRSTQPTDRPDRFASYPRKRTITYR
jgi:hypothetical protein